MKRSIPALTITACLVSGCVSYSLDGNDILRTDAQLERSGRNLSVGPDLGAAGEALDAVVTEERLSAPFGEIALTRFERNSGDQPIVIFCGGSLFRQDTRGAASFEALFRLGDVWLVDYPGYGRSEGNGTVEEFVAYEDIVVARLQQAVGTMPIQRPIFVGHSFGGGVCASMASRFPNRSNLVLLGAFRNHEAVVKARAGWFGWIVRPEISNDLPNTDIVSALAGYQGHVVVVAAENDPTVPYAASRSLSRDLSNEGVSVDFITVPGADHSGLVERIPTLEAVSRSLSGREDAERAPQ